MTDLNQLRVACEHGKWERHATYVAKDGSEKFIPWHVAAEITDGSAGECPGGRVLNQAIIWWCEEHRAGESAEEGTCEVAAALLTFSNYSNHCQMAETLLAPMDALASAQEER